VAGAAGPTSYEPLRGEEFFLLSDASVGSDGVAVVRLEVPEAWDVARYGGVDIVVYRVPNPPEFLKAQPTLHRVQVRPLHVGEGLGNTLRYLWSKPGILRRAVGRGLGPAPGQLPGVGSLHAVRDELHDAQHRATPVDGRDPEDHPVRNGIAHALVRRGSGLGHPETGPHRLARCDGCRRERRVRKDVRATGGVHGGHDPAHFSRHVTLPPASGHVVGVYAPPPASTARGGAARYRSQAA